VHGQWRPPHERGGLTASNWQSTASAKGLARWRLRHTADEKHHERFVDDGPDGPRRHEGSWRIDQESASQNAQDFFKLDADLPNDLLGLREIVTSLIAAQAIAGTADGEALLV